MSSEECFPPTVYWYSRCGVGGIQMFSQQSAVMDLQTFPFRIQFIPDHQNITVVQVVHHLHHTGPVGCTRVENRLLTWQINMQFIKQVAAKTSLDKNPEYFQDSRPPNASPLRTVLVIRSSLKGATPSGLRRSLAGLTCCFDPVMVILGSLGAKTMTTALMSGTERHVSSPKHLTHNRRMSL